LVGLVVIVVLVGTNGVILVPNELGTSGVMVEVPAMVLKPSGLVVGTSGGVFADMMLARLETVLAAGWDKGIERRFRLDVGSEVKTLSMPVEDDVVVLLIDVVDGGAGRIGADIGDNDLVVFFGVVMGLI
jgi:hypothetical protein